MRASIRTHSTQRQLYTGSLCQPKHWKRPFYALILYKFLLFVRNCLLLQRLARFGSRSTGIKDIASSGRDVEAATTSRSIIPPSCDRRRGGATSARLDLRSNENSIAEDGHLLTSERETKSEQHDPSADTLL